MITRNTETGTNILGNMINLNKGTLNHKYITIAMVEIGITFNKIKITLAIMIGVRIIILINFEYLTNSF